MDKIDLKIATATAVVVLIMLQIGLTKEVAAIIGAGSFFGLEGYALLKAYMDSKKEQLPTKVINNSGSGQVYDNTSPPTMPR